MNESLHEKLVRAEPGEQVIYWVGSKGVGSKGPPIFKDAMRAYETGLCELVQRRVSEDVSCYIAVKKRRCW